MKLKTILLFFSFLIAFSVSSQQVGDIFSSGGINYKITSLSPRTVSVAKHPSFSGSANIPSMVTYSKVEFTVTSVGYEAFTYCPNLKEVTFPNTLENIEDRAFSGCTGLKQVVIPESVKEIGDYAFYGCTGIDTLFFNATHCERMGGNYNDGHRPGFSILNTVIIGDNVKKLPNYAFAYCKNLAVVKLGKSVTEIGYHPFEGCPISKVYYNAVKCEKVDKSGIFFDGIQEVYVGGHVKTIPANAFKAQPLLYVKMGPSVETIGKHAFSYSRDFSAIDIPPSIKSVGDSAFYECNKLENIYCYATEAPQVGQDAFSGVRYNNKLWVCPSSTGFPTVGTRWNNLVIAHDLDMCDGIGIVETVENGNSVEISIINSGEISIKQIPESVDRLHLYSGNGTLLLTQTIESSSIILNTGMLPSGVYYLSIGGTVHKVLKP